MNKYLKITPEETLLRMGEHEVAFWESKIYWTTKNIARLMCTSVYRVQKVIKHLKYHGNIVLDCTQPDCSCFNENQNFCECGSFVPKRHWVITSTGKESIQRLKRYQISTPAVTFQLSTPPCEIHPAVEDMQKRLHNN